MAHFDLLLDTFHIHVLNKIFDLLCRYHFTPVFFVSTVKTFFRFQLPVHIIMCELAIGTTYRQLILAAISESPESNFAVTIRIDMSGIPAELPVFELALADR